jgi:hypothetical protein
VGWVLGGFGKWLFIGVMYTWSHMIDWSIRLSYPEFTAKLIDCIRIFRFASTGKGARR